jgi:hypothetical protein
MKVIVELDEDDIRALEAARQNEKIGMDPSYTIMGHPVSFEVNVYEAYIQARDSE